MAGSIRKMLFGNSKDMNKLLILLGVVLLIVILYFFFNRRSNMNVVFNVIASIIIKNSYILNNASDDQYVICNLMRDLPVDKIPLKQALDSSKYSGTTQANVKIRVYYFGEGGGWQYNGWGQNAGNLGYNNPNSPLEITLNGNGGTGTNTSKYFNFWRGDKNTYTRTLDPNPTQNNIPLIVYVNGWWPGPANLGQPEGFACRYMTAETGTAINNIMGNTLGLADGGTYSIGLWWSAASGQVCPIVRLESGYVLLKQPIFDVYSLWNNNQAAIDGVRTQGLVNNNVLTNYIPTPLAAPPPNNVLSDLVTIRNNGALTFYVRTLTVGNNVPGGWVGIGSMGTFTLNGTFSGVQFAADQDGTKPLTNAQVSFGTASGGVWNAAGDTYTFTSPNIIGYNTATVNNNIPGGDNGYFVRSFLSPGNKGSN
jgi:hypothetical protein